MGVQVFADAGCVRSSVPGTGLVAVQMPCCGAVVPWYPQSVLSK